MMTNPFAWLLITPMICAILVYVIGRILAPEDDRLTENKSVWLCLASIAVTAVPYLLTVREFRQNGPLSLEISSVKLTFDGISLLMISVLLILSFAVILFSSKYMAAEDHEEKFYAQIMVLITSIIGLTCATDIFNLYVWYELMAISTYTLVSFYRTRTEPLEAGIKYLVQSAAGSVFIILGIAILFGVTDKVELAGIRASIQSTTPAVIAAAACFLIGYGIKCAFVPLHFWLPDAHSQAPAGISALLSGIVIETGLIALLRTLSTVSRAGLPLGVVFLLFGALNMLVGNLSALRQTEVKRMFAFSSIAHMGYIVTGVGFALTFSASAQAADGIFAHIFNHAMMKGLAFLTAGAMVYHLKIAKGSHEPLFVNDLNGISKRYPFLALALSIAVLALGGLPLFSGFVSKWQILASGAAANNGWAFAMILLMGLNSVLSLGYYAPLVNRMYRHKMDAADDEDAREVQPVSAAMTAAILLLTALVILYGFFPDLSGSLTKVAGDTLSTLFY